jgi:acetyl-CoA acyltransferase
MREVAIIAASRTPIGRYGGALSEVRPDDLAAAAVAAALDQVPQLETSRIDDVVLGAANQAGEDNRNVGRMAALLLGLDSVPGRTVNRLCASGLQAINDAAATIAFGAAEVIVAGGVESMTRAPFVLAKSTRAFDRGTELHDSTIGWRFVNPRMPVEHTIGLGLSAERLADSYSISRSEQDEFALRSHELAIAARDSGQTDIEVAPLNVGELTVKEDECPRRDSRLELLGKLRPAFRQDGTVTAGNSSSLNDGAAAVILCARRTAEELGVPVLGTIERFAVAAVEPATFGIGPVPAIRKVVEQGGRSLRRFDHVELNEAFAAQALACLRELDDLDPDRVNPLGGAIALGHPLGCSGARLMVTLVHGLRARGGGRGLASLCVAGGQGIATEVLCPG